MPGPNGQWSQWSQWSQWPQPKHAPNPDSVTKKFKPHFLSGGHPAAHRYPVHWTGDSVSLATTVGDMLDSAVSGLCRMQFVQYGSKLPFTGQTCPHVWWYKRHVVFIAFRQNVDLLDSAFSGFMQYVHSDCGTHLNMPPGGNNSLQGGDNIRWTALCTFSVSSSITPSVSHLGPHCFLRLIGPENKR